MKSILVLFAAPLVLAAGDGPSFAKDVAPILASNCLGCHVAQVKMGSFNIETFEGLQQGGHHGPVIVPGKSEESRLYQMITGKEKPLMPMSGQPLAAGDIDTIRKWIDAGATPPAPGELTSLADLNKAKTPEVRAKAGLRPQIYSMAYSPDGTLLALGGFHEVRLVDPATGKTVATLSGHKEAVRAVAFSRDGKRLAAAGGLPARRGEVRIWDVARREPAATVEGHSDCIYAVAFTPDGTSIATSSYDKLIKLWDASTGKEIRTLKDHIDAIYALVFTPDGKRLISAAADRSVKVWDVATGTRLYTMSESLDGLNTVALNPAGTQVAAGGLDKTIRIWNLGDKQATPANSLIAHEDAILKLAYSPDGKTLASAAADHTVKFFKADDLTELKTLADQPDWVMALEFSPDGTSIAAGRFDGSLSIYDAATYRDKLELHRASR